MHLRALKLRGFKSFPDTTEIRLEPGVAVVVGPNGSGKSNIADALVWAAGSQAPSELRAERADDVLFAGAAGRAAAAFAEVELSFDNEDGALAALPFAEISIARRLHRGGEGQYLVNGATVRRTDVVELLADVGLGAGLGSIIGQGRVEAVLASKPEERRALVEEAAGLGRFKRRRHRAELKLARVAVQVERARDLEEEVAKRLRPLALQATAAERAERLSVEIETLRATIATFDLEALSARRAEAEGRRTAARLEREHLNRRLESLLQERGGVEEELADAAGRREAATAALYRLRSARERLSLRLEAVEELRDRLRGELAETREQPPEGSSPDEDPRLRAARVRDEADGAEAQARLSADRARIAAERLVTLDRALAEREGLPPAARALAERGHELALALLDVDPGYERAVAAALAWRAAAVVAADVSAGLELLERARAEGLGTVAVLVGGAEAAPAAEPPVAGAEPLASHARPRDERVEGALDDVWVVELEELAVARRGTVVTLEGHCYEPRSGRLAWAGEAAEAVLMELDARRQALAVEAAELGVRAEGAAALARRAAAAAAQAEAQARTAAPARRPALPAAAALAPIVAAADRAASLLEQARLTASRLDGPLEARSEVGSRKAGDLAAALRKLAGEEVEARGAVSASAERAGAIEVELARIEADAAEAARRLEQAGALAETAGTATRENLTTKLERLERRREQLGSVNPLAKEEYEQEKERLSELRAQREDLERALEELEQLRSELDSTVERRFTETFEAVRAHFTEVAQTLFPGGEGRLSLTELETEEEVPGIEVELRPAGKRVTRLSLLSGGEKSLGAIAFLFSLFLARPCPFYLLDEVEAALDDTNIGRFVELLRGYADRAQFIVITHQKRTMEAADTLYGVTMAADGVSQIVSRRLPQAPTAVAAGA